MSLKSDLQREVINKDMEATLSAKVGELFGKTIQENLVKEIQKVKDKLDSLQNETIKLLLIDIRKIFNGIFNKHFVNLPISF